MKVFNSSQIHDLDAAAIRDEQISSLELMERAAIACAEFLLTHIGRFDRRIVVFAGPGGNGGDGLAIARLLSKAGFSDISVFLFNTRNQLSDDCRENSEKLQQECPQVTFSEITQQFETPKLDEDTLVIDALFGIGLKKPLNGGFASLVKLINSSPAEVVSIDIPSGLLCEDNSFNTPSTIVSADHTLTLHAPKLSLLLDDTLPYVGEMHLLPIGISRETEEKIESAFQLTTAEDIRGMWKKRPVSGHKGTFGHALLVAGSYGMAGAAILSTQACLRSGVGKVTVHTPELNNNILQTAVPEAVLSLDKHPKVFTSPVRTDAFDAIAIGPGIGTGKETALAFIEQVSHVAVPMVIDADAINILGDHKGWMTQIPQNVVFTPHPGEMQKLGICRHDSFSMLLEAVNLCHRHQFYIIFKGHHSAVCTPEGKVFFNTTGNSGMGTAGSGDVLTGIVTALLAQHYSMLDACRMGVYLHGLAGDIAAEKLGEHSVTAHDIIAALPQAFRKLTL